MKFKNETEENVKYRVGTRKGGYDWYNVRPGEVVDIPEDSGRCLSLTVVEELQKHSKGVDKSPQTPDKLPSEDPARKFYKAKLVDINGVGKKTAEEIMEKYPTIELLKKGIAQSEEIHNRDDVDEKVKEEFN